MGILDLWLPTLVSAIVTFLASSLIWMVFRWHNRDYRATADEETLREALRGSEPGFYILPYCMDPSEFKRPEVRQKYEDGPQAYITILANGLPSMAPRLLATFLFFLLVAVLCAYLVSRTIGATGGYLEVFRIAGTVSFLAHFVAIIPESIWFGRPWAMTLKNGVDSVIYALLTAGIFGWLS